jgi:Leucine-rich repeat (LRR) protein
MTMLQDIDISANRLTSYIPSGLGSCKELECLNISSNALEVMMQVSLGELLSLQDMDFSSNNCLDGIPTSLTNLKMLDQLNLYFNN